MISWVSESGDVTEDTVRDLTVSTKEAGTTKYFWNIVDLNKTGKSNTVTTTVTICGLEDLLLVDESPASIVVAG